MTAAFVVFNLFNADHFANSICESLGFESGKCHIHEFPDRETLVRIETPVQDRSVILVASLDDPNTKIAPLIFAAEALREAGAAKIGIVVPYLAYMRQDKQFHLGEGITSKYFAKIISTYFDWIITIDPHLHRWHSLNDIFTIPTTLLHASSDIAQWIKLNISKPVLIGPDKESQQWIADVAKSVDAPFLIVEKQRVSDVSVKSTIPQIETYSNYMPVVIDDIISTAQTMIETVNHLKNLGMPSIHCIGVHAIFAGNAYHDLLSTGITEIATCNTIMHTTNKIDLSNLIIDAISKLKLNG